MNRRLIHLAVEAKLPANHALSRADRRRLAKEAAKQSQLPLSEVWRGAVPPVKSGEDAQLMQCIRGTPLDPGEIHVPVEMKPGGVPEPGEITIPIVNPGQSP